jgi:hypothetical protein
MNLNEIVTACCKLDGSVEFWELVSTFSHEPMLELTHDGFRLVFDEAREWTYEIATGSSRHTSGTLFATRRCPQHKGHFCDSRGMVFDQKAAHALWDTVIGQLIA